MIKIAKRTEFEGLVSDMLKGMGIKPTSMNIRRASNVLTKRIAASKYYGKRKFKRHQLKMERSQMRYNKCRKNMPLMLLANSRKRKKRRNPVKTISKRPGSRKLRKMMLRDAGRLRTLSMPEIMKLEQAGKIRKIWTNRKRGKKRSKMTFEKRAFTLSPAEMRKLESAGKIRRVWTNKKKTRRRPFRVQIFNARSGGYETFSTYNNIKDALSAKRQIEGGGKKARILLGRKAMLLNGSKKKKRVIKRKKTRGKKVKMTPVRGIGKAMRAIKGLPPCLTPGLRKALKMYYHRHGCYPPSITKTNVPNGYPKYGVSMGRMGEVMYKAPKSPVKGGHLYKHVFENPTVLVTDPSGKGLFIVNPKMKAKRWIEN